jgi:hypothetical protein
VSHVGDNDHNDIQHNVLQELDLSSCNIGDSGAEALALALAFNPHCLSKLDLSNNAISDTGAVAIGRALVEGYRRKFVNEGKSCCVLEEIVLDNNAKIGDDGVEALAEAMTCGAVKCISLRSCSVKAGGAAAFGKTIVSLAKQKLDTEDDPITFRIDLSGNTLGVKPVKKKKGLKDKASSHISSLGKTLQKGWRGGLKGAGVSIGLTAESDDDEENVMGGLIDAEEEEDNPNLFDSAARCGARAFTAEILNEDNNGDLNQEQVPGVNICISFRRCNLDDGAVDALSAAVTEIRRKSGTNLAIDVSMNTVEPETVSALIGDTKQAMLLNSMAQRHMNALLVLKEAQERAMMAIEAAKARADAEKQFGGFLFADVDSDYQYDDEY